MDEPLFHVALAGDWEAARSVGRYEVSTRGRTLGDVGFIHCSFADQVAGTVRRFYADADDVVVLRIDASKLRSRVEVEDGFPHIYGPIEVDAVAEVTPWRAGPIDHDVPLMVQEDDDRLDVEDVRPFVPAQDFARSKAFYEALGWTTVWTDEEGLALMELGGHHVMLQNFYVQEWAENFMLTIAVRDASAWHRRAAAVLASGEFGAARVAEPKEEDWATVTYVWDPSGVLLHFAQFDK